MVLQCLLRSCHVWVLLVRMLSSSFGEETLNGIEDLWDKYSDIFPHGNRNAASHRWATYILERSSTLSASTLQDLFGGFCAVSGSPVRPGKSHTWHYALPRVGGGKISGNVNHCCWPCVCDTQDLIKVDTKSVATRDGDTQFKFLVIGNPCVRPGLLPEHAPDVNCHDGQLEKAILSDHGHVIIGMIFEDGLPGMDSASTNQQCKSRASSGYNSGMGQIFRMVAAINPVLDVDFTPKINVGNSYERSKHCHTIVSKVEEDAIKSKILENPVMIFGIDGMRCTVAATEALESRNVCISKQFFAQDSPTWSYFKCLYPYERVGSTKMHSYVFIGGRFVGNGFRLLLDSNDDRCTDGAPPAEPCLSPEALDAKLHAASARTCQKDCLNVLPADGVTKINNDISSSSLVLYGWAKCPCTGLARARFQERGVCYIENIWSSPDSLTMKYLQCRYGQEHHSFVWAGGKFVGNGFMFDPNRMSSDQYTALLSKANAQVGMCQTKGDKNLNNGDLQSCTQSGDGTATGWTRTGSCVWDPQDGGYHQVCVSMSRKFLESSRDHDSNDLSSVVSEDGHWCICAWAWASAVSRDPDNMEGITIDCERTNGRLRQVYELHIREGTDLRSPSGAYYKAKNALDALNKKCPPAQNMTQRPSFSGPESKEVALASRQAKMLNAPGTDGGSASSETSSAQSTVPIDSSKFIMASICAALLAALCKYSKGNCWSLLCKGIKANPNKSRNTSAIKLGKDSATESDGDTRAIGA